MQNIKKKKVLIIGGCGYIGTSLFNFLQNKWIDVDTVDLEWFGNNSNPNNINIDYKYLTKDFLSKYDSIVLLAGHASMQLCQNSMKSSFKNNVENFINILDKIDKQRLIYAGSSSVYGALPGIRTEEDQISGPITFYDVAKAEIDSYALLANKNTYGLRFGTVNGFSPSLRIDIMINAMIHNGMSNGSINLLNAETRRPLLYINDLNRAIYSIIIDEKDKPGIYNLASFNTTSGAVAKEVSEILGFKIIDKGVGKTIYDFEIDSSKFKNAYNFQFEGTIKKIVYNLYSNYGEATSKTTRNLEIEYL